jgi:hypothetical protein
MTRNGLLTINMALLLSSLVSTQTHFPGLEVLVLTSQGSKTLLLPLAVAEAAEHHQTCLNSFLARWEAQQVEVNHHEEQT